MANCRAGKQIWNHVILAAKRLQDQSFVISCEGFSEGTPLANGKADSELTCLTHYPWNTILSNISFWTDKKMLPNTSLITFIVPFSILSLSLSHQKTHRTKWIGSNNHHCRRHHHHRHASSSSRLSEVEINSTNNQSIAKAETELFTTRLFFLPSQPQIITSILRSVHNVDS